MRFSRAWASRFRENRQPKASKNDIKATISCVIEGVMINVRNSTDVERGLSDDSPTLGGQTDIHQRYALMEKPNAASQVRRSKAAPPVTGLPLSSWNSNSNLGPEQESAYADVLPFGPATAVGPSDMAESQDQAVSIAVLEAGNAAVLVHFQQARLSPGQRDRLRGHQAGSRNQLAQEMTAIKLIEHQVERREPNYTSEKDDAGAISKATYADRYVALRLRQRRMMMGLTQKQLAHQCGVTYQQVFKYETGVTRISAGRLYEISKVLDVEISWFFEGMAKQNNTKEQSPSRRMMLEFMRNVFAIEDTEHLNALSNVVRALA